jgi:hypothetical protein
LQRLRPELWRQKNWLLHHNNTPFTLPFSPGNYWPKTTWVAHMHPTFLCFHNWRCNWKGAMLTKLR